MPRPIINSCAQLVATYSGVLPNLHVGYFVANVIQFKEVVTQLSRLRTEELGPLTSRLCPYAYQTLKARDLQHLVVFS